MKALAKAALLFALGAAALFFFIEDEPAGDPALPPLPAEALFLPTSGDFCRSELLERSLGAAAFRWVRRESPVWAHRLTVGCDQPEGSVALTVAGQRLVYKRQPGFDGDNVTARVIARLLPLQPAVRDAALKAYLANQPDVARAGADLWRARRWDEAVRQLSTALENNWADADQADLYFGLADSWARLGRPRQAFWYGLAYLALANKEPPQAWVTSLRGAAGLVAEQPSNVEPEAEALVRQWRAQAAAKRYDLALETLKRLSLAAPWSDRYQEDVAELYARLGWDVLASSWRRRAMLTRRVAADGALQARFAALVR